MANVIPTWNADPATCRTNIASAIGLANNGDSLVFTNQGGGGVWNVAGFSDGTENLATATGAIEITKNLTVVLSAGVTLAESSASPLQGDYQPLLRFKGCNGCGITFGAGSKLLGARAAHAGDLTTEWLAGAKFLGCSNVTITGTGELCFDGFYGDGLWFASGAYDSVAANSSVLVSNVWVGNNYRNGLTIEDCIGTFNNIKATGNIGTQPQSGICVETDNTSDTLQVIFNGGYLEGRSRGFVATIVDALTPAIQITLNGLRSVRSSVAGDDPWGFDFACIAASTPAGSFIKCINCEAINLKSAGFHWGGAATYPIDTAMVITLTRCGVRNCAVNDLEKPFELVLSGSPTGGGINFNDCWCEDNRNRKVTNVSSSGGAATNVKGTIRTLGRATPRGSQVQSLLPNLRVGSFGRPNNSLKAQTRRSANRGAL